MLIFIRAINVKFLHHAIIPFILLITGCTANVLEIPLDQKEQTPTLTTSVERQNIVSRLELAQNPNTIMWIYCLSDTGQYIFFSPVRGKVTSSTKRLEPTHGFETSDTYVSGAIRVNTVKNGNVRTSELMQADGTFGSSDNYVYWFDPEGNYYQWNGPYFVSTVPIKLKTAVLSVRDIDYETKAKAETLETKLAAGETVNNSELITE